MNHTSFRAIVVNETENKQFVRNVVAREVSSLPEGDVFIQVHYSSVNYPPLSISYEPTPSGGFSVHRYF
ncbi:hypothetical protein BN2127_JRS1_02050 [Bacillus cereus]|nr:hypothetical protein BN2127_JRS1_02050 [Bacillus cereus]